MRLVGLADEDGKYLASRFCPAAESLPAGAEMVPPNPALLYAVTPIDSAPKAMTPISSATAGRLTTRVATLPHRPAEEVPGFGFDGQKAALPKIASSAGSRVSPASSMMPMPIASGMPKLE